MHPTEGMWQSFLDLEAPDPEHLELELHLSTCPDCCSTTVELGRRRARVTQLLNTLAVSTPSRNHLEVLSSRRSSSRSLLWAAGIALCVSTAASATVHWGIWQRAEEWLLGASSSSEAAPVVPQPPVAGPASTSGISLQPRQRLDVLFDEVPPSGQIEITVRNDAGFSIIASEPVRYSVRQGSVSVANSGVAANYRIALPESLPQASIRVAGRLVCVKHGAALIGEAHKIGPRTYVISFSSGRQPSPPVPVQ